MSARSSWHSPWHLVLGLAAWSLWFVVLYGGVSLACAADAPWHAALRPLAGLLAALLGVAAAACARAARALPRTRGATDGQRFVTASSAALYAVAALATLIVSLPLWLLPPCV